jgi:hypothetical protein
MLGPTPLATGVPPALLPAPAGLLALLPSLLLLLLVVLLLLKAPGKSCSMSMRVAVTFRLVSRSVDCGNRMSVKRWSSTFKEVRL